MVRIHGHSVQTEYLDAENGVLIGVTSLAVTKSKRSEESTWFGAEFRGSLVEIAERHLKQGDWIHVVGRVVVDTFLENAIFQSQPRITLHTQEFFHSFLQLSTIVNSPRGAFNAVEVIKLNIDYCLCSCDSD